MPDTFNDPAAADALDRYLHDLHAGVAPDRSALLDQHPELASALRCLEALDRVAPVLDGGDDESADELAGVTSRRSDDLSAPSNAGQERTSRFGDEAHHDAPDGEFAGPTSEIGEQAGVGRGVEATMSVASGKADGEVGGEVGVRSDSKESSSVRESFPSVLSVFPCDLGPYELLGTLGRGGMGVVYKARHKPLDRLVAIKMIQPSLLTSPDHVRRFQKEARAAAQLKHPNIVHVHDVSRHKGQHFFVMEFVEGESLAERLRREPLEVGAAVALMISVARAVDHLHDQGIVHRDLKPSNILLDSEGRPFVTDFGLAKFFTPEAGETSSGLIAGTPQYMAPEQALGDSQRIGPATDVYGLGAILYELLTGRPPFNEKHAVDTLLRLVSIDPPLPTEINPAIPRPLELICLKCLAKTPGDRYASAREVAEELQRYEDGEPLTVRPPTIAERVVRWARREPALAAHLAVFAFFMCIHPANYFIFQNITETEFRPLMGLLLVWTGTCVALQQLTKIPGWSNYVRYGWGLCDALFLLWGLLAAADGVASSLIVGFPLLICGSGLWFQVRFVVFMTTLCVLGYTLLAVDFYVRIFYDGTPFPGRLDRHIIYATSLMVIGWMVAAIVHRVRVLSEKHGRQLV